MKRLSHIVPAIVMLLCGTLHSNAQGENNEYPRLLGKTTELDLRDSLNFESVPADTLMLDSTTVKKFFPQLLSNGANRFKNRAYCLLGKITSNSNYDLLLLLEDKKKNDTSEIQVVYLVSMRKSGDYIASIKATVNGVKKRTAYNIRSCMYKGNRIVQDSRITTNEQMYDDMTYYKITNGGRFIIDGSN
jgi:hypothetical protein